jgi:HlyD family secretion protein
MKEVKTGIQDDEFIEITTGIKPGDKIVTAPYEAISKKLKSGAKIKAIKEAELYQESKKSSGSK